ncbi:MAG TPA: polysaccharide deacetylase family protein [Kineosporiaceae bacterium]
MPARLRRKALIGAATVALAAGAAVAVPAVTPANAAAPNLVPNASAEALSRGVPTGWIKGFNGVNRASLSAVTSGGKVGPAFVRVKITARTSGGAWWATPAVAVRPGASYTFTEYYRSGVATRVLAEGFVGRDIVWLSLGTARPANVWTGAGYTLTVPAGVTQVRLAHVLQAVGTLDVDGVSLTLRPSTPAVTAPATTKPAATTPAVTKAPVTAAATSGLVSMTFDDGTSDHYTNALPILKANGQVGVFYLISGYLGASHYLTVDQAKQIQAAGNEIGAHTVDHPDLTKLSQAQVEAELRDSKRMLEANFGPVTDLAYPYGASNAQVRQIAATYYASGRSTDGGANVPGQYDRYRLTIGYVLNTTTVAQVDQWLAQAKAANSWLILCFHGVSDGRPNETYNVSISQFTGMMAAVKESGLRNVTVRSGLALTGN